MAVKRIKRAIWLLLSVGLAVAAGFLVEQIYEEIPKILPLVVAGIAAAILLFVLGRLFKIEGIGRNRGYVSLSAIAEPFQKILNLAKGNYEDVNNIFVALDEIASPVNQQASDLNVISDKVNELSEYLDSIYHNFNMILKDAEAINRLSDLGLNNSQLLQEKFVVTQDSTDSIVQILEDFTGTINDVNGILGFIREVGEQTNLLALNATIEAARAGSAGSGFGVVAQEFSKLSQQSEEYTDDVAKLLKQMSAQFSVLTESIGSLAQSIKEQRGSVGQTSDSFAKIAESVSSITGEMQKVDRSINQMHGSKDEVFDLIKETASLSAQTADSSEKFAVIIAENLQSVGGIYQSLESLKQDLPEH